MIVNGFYRKPGELDSHDVEFLCYGVPRSGSTLIYQIVSSLYQEGVAKVHRYSDLPVKTVASYRDFRDVVVSRWRVGDPQNRFRKMTGSEVEMFANRILGQVKELDRYAERPDVCLLRYEEFFRKPELIFSALQSRFGIVVPPAQQNRLIKKFSLAANRRIAERLKTFQDVDPKTEIHGQHIYRGEVGGWREFVDDQGAGRLQQLFKPALVRYGYAA